MEASELKIPQHVAIIMDGNGRWAKSKHRPRTYGHTIGSKVLEQTVRDVDDLGIKYLTVYAFSTENWSRPLQEVDFLMNLFVEYLRKEVEECMKNNVKLMIIGDRSKLNPILLEAINKIEKATENNTGLQFRIAFNYGSRAELLKATREIAEEAAAGRLDPAEISAADIESRLYTAGVPDPDLLIRTSGEERLSNFLMWQLAYSEFYFTDISWPEFNKAELIKAIEKYSGRDRRYGGIKEEK